MGRPYDDFWLLGISATGQEGRKFFDRLAHCNWGDEVRVFESPPRRYLGGEPVCVRHPDDDGLVVVICQEFDAELDRGAFLVFDGRDVGAGPLARVPLISPVPLLFHAVFEASA
jgi:carotenoid cleavage dioxygenase-like enzyme